MFTELHNRYLESMERKKQEIRKLYEKWRTETSKGRKASWTAKMNYQKELLQRQRERYIKALNETPELMWIEI